MMEKSPVTSSQTVGDPILDSSTTQISFCPHLSLYHYKRADDTEYFFDEDQLEKAIETYLGVGDTRQAEFMATLTSWARKFPHKLVTIYADGRFRVQKLEPRKRDLEGTERPEVVDAETVEPKKS
jgi:hypothetical protein